MNTNQEWSDQKCIEIAFQNNFPSIVKEGNIQKKIANNFLNFYLTGRVPKGQRLTDILFAAISIMPFYHRETIIDNFIWNEDHYSKDGTLFFLTPEDKLRYEIKTVIEKTTDTEVFNENFEQKPNPSKEIQTNENSEDLGQETKITTEIKDDKRDLEEEVNCAEDDSKNLETGYFIPKISNNEDETLLNRTMGMSNIIWFRLKKSKEIDITKEIQYGPVENAKFCMSCNKILDNWENPELQCILKNFFGVTALVLMRTRAKSIQNLETYFKTKFISLDINIDVIKYTPPHKSCIVKSWKVFRKNTPEIHTMFAKFIVNSFYNSNYATNSYNIFRASVLSHTVYVGMGIIALLHRIALYTDNFYKTYECLKCEEIRDSWENAKQFFAKYMTGGNTKMHHWARLVAPEYFLELSCTNNYKMAVVLAVFVEKLSGSQEVWKAGWIKNKTYDLESLKKLGYSIYDRYISSDTI